MKRYYIQKPTIYPNICERMPIPEDVVQQIKTDAVEECKEVVNNLLSYYRDEYHFGVTFNIMCNSINDRIEQLKEQENDI